MFTSTTFCILPVFIMHVFCAGQDTAQVPHQLAAGRSGDSGDGGSGGFSCNMSSCFSYYYIILTVFSEALLCLATKSLLSLTDSAAY